MIYRFLLVSFLLVNTPFILHAQYGTYTARRSGLMDGNNIHTVFTNSGVLAQPSNLLPHLSWRGDNNGYFGDLSIVIGAELPLKDYNNDGKIDTIHLVEITNADRPGGGKTGVGGRSWTFEPIPGFNNAANSDVLGGIALSNNPSTWPTTPWPDHPEWGTGKWNGLIGANSFTGKQEAYFVMDDQNDDQAIQVAADSVSKSAFDIYSSIIHS
jgi:hypothetical protein